MILIERVVRDVPTNIPTHETPPMVATLRSELDLFGPIENEVALAVQRLGEWLPCYKPRSAKEKWFLAEMVIHSIRMERCRSIEMALCANRSQRAADHWDEDRRAEAETLLLQ